MLSFANAFIIISIHPLTYCALALGLSILSSSLFIPWIIGGILSIVIMQTFSGHPHKQRWIILLVLLYIGGAWRYHSSIHEHYAFTRLLENKKCTLKGAIISIDYQDNQRYRQRITLNIDTITLPDQTTLSTQKTILIYLSRSTDARVSDEIEIYDFCVQKNKNESYEYYLIKENIAATAFLPSLNYTLIRRPSFSLLRSISYFKQELLSRCRKKLSRPVFSFFASVFLGNKSHEKKHMEEPKENCRTWGISHYLARSGLHMVIFIYLCHLLLSLFPLSFFFKQAMLICIGILYHILSWPSISFIRAFISFLLFKSCAVLQVSSHLLHLLSLVTLGVLLYNPMQLFFLDFQLSFGLTFALAWFNHVAEKKALLAGKY